MAWRREWASGAARRNLAHVDGCCDGKVAVETEKANTPVANNSAAKLKELALGGKRTELRLSA